jgi:L-lactate dehydrogenase complex protein LldG
MSDRDTVLRRIRSAVGNDVPRADEAQAVARAYRRAGSRSRAARVKEFAVRVAEYHALVHRIRANELADAVAAACRRRSIHSLVVPGDIPSEWLPTGVEIQRDGAAGEIPNEELDRSDGVLTGCALGIAQTGTIVLDSGLLQGRRVLTLLPDYHLCVIREDQIVGLVPEAMALLQPTEKSGHRPLTFVSGPSATSDIELNRVEGVHGPRTLEVLIVGHS